MTERETTPALTRYALFHYRDESDLDSHPEGDWVKLEDVRALFAAEDVQALREVAASYWMGDPEGYPVHLRSIADRITPLLPA